VDECKPLAAGRPAPSVPRRLGAAAARDERTRGVPGRPGVGQAAAPHARELRGLARGRAARVDSIKSTLKVPRTQRLKLTYDEPLSIFAFKFSLRSYTEAPRSAPGSGSGAGAGSWAGAGSGAGAGAGQARPVGVFGRGGEDLLGRQLDFEFQSPDSPAGGDPYAFAQEIRRIINAVK